MAKRMPSEVGVDEYLWAAEQTGGFRPMAKFLGLKYTSMMDDLERRGVKAHVYQLLDEKPGKPGPKRPPAPLIEGVGPNDDADIEAIKEAAIRLSEAKKEKTARKEDQHLRFPHGPVAIAFLGDQHIGNQGTDLKRMYEEQEVILGSPATYVWQMGDLIDNFIIGKLMAENMKPSTPVWHQWRLGGAYLRDFADKLLAVCGGNHEAWTRRLVGIDFTKETVPGPGILYDADEVKATVHIGEREFKVRSRHKWKNKSQYNQTHGQEWSMRFDDPEPDIYVGAHTHTGAVARETVHGRRRKLSIQTGSYKTIDDFARVVGFATNDASTACALILNDSGSMWACADLLAMREYMTSVYGKVA